VVEGHHLVVEACHLEEEVVLHLEEVVVLRLEGEAFLHQEVLEVRHRVEVVVEAVQPLVEVVAVRLN
jgi:hypothetical protein